MTHDFKWRHFRGEIILWAVRWYCSCGVSYRDLEEMLEERGVSVDHTTIYRWVQAPELEGRRVTPHLIRHSSACLMLKSRIDLNTIRSWLGHESLDTTNVYAEIDLETKARAMALCDATEEGPERPWKEDTGLMAFLDTL